MSHGKSSKAIAFPVNASDLKDLWGSDPAEIGNLVLALLPFLVLLFTEYC